MACSSANKQATAEEAETVPEEIAVAEIVQGEVTPEEITAEEIAPPEVIVPRFSLSAESGRPGEPITVGYSGDFGGQPPPGLRALLLNEQGRRLAGSAFFKLPVDEGEQELMAAILPIPYGTATGNALIRIEAADGPIRDLPFRIESREFLSETIALDESNTAIRTSTDPQRTVESQELWALLTRTGTELYTDGVFSPPVTSTRRTSQYGFRRVYKYVDGNTDTSVHGGLDYGVPTGTPVMAAARGRVVMANSRIVSGNTVVLEHLPGIYSLYYHMNSLAVAVGDIAEAGSVLGESGSTGLSTGPHLHWEMRVSSECLDPDTFLDRHILDKNDIFNKMVY